MSCNVVIYARTSPDCTATGEDQIQHLKAVATERGWTVCSVLIDRQATVKKDRRPAESALIEAIRAGGVEKVVLWSIDRVGRSLVDLVGFLETCRTADVSLWLDEQGIDTATTNGAALHDVATLMAYHLHQTRRDRILRGQAAVRGLVRFGRPPIPTTKLDKARRELANGKGVRQVARLAGISAASVSRLKNAQVST